MKYSKCGTIYDLHRCGKSWVVVSFYNQIFGKEVGKGCEAAMKAFLLPIKLTRMVTCAIIHYQLTWRCEMSGKRSLVFGVGINDWAGKVWVDGKQIKEYKLWQSMLKRCFCGKHKQKYPTYKDVTCSKEWLLMTSFIEDVSKMNGYGLKGWDLDKDILVKGNKLYSKDACCFVPQEINMLLTKRDNCRGEWPVGVYFNKHAGKFMANLRINGKMKFLGYFTTPEEAFQAYKLAKEAQIKVVAEKWKHQLDERVYLALLAYEVNIDD